MRGSRLLLVLVTLTLLVSLGPAAWGQRVPRATCLDCHEAEGMVYAVIQTTPFVSVPQGETQELEVTIGNPWLHDITSSLVTMDLTDAPTMSFDVPDPLNVSESAELTPQSRTLAVPFEVQAGVTGVVVRMTQPPDPTDLGLIDVDTRVTFPEGPAAVAEQDGVVTNGAPTPPRASEQFVFRGENLATRPTGTWTVIANLTQTSPPTPVAVEVNVFYNATRTQSQLLPELIGPGRSGSINFLVRGIEQGPASADLSIVVTADYAHPPGIGAQDTGNQTLRSGLNFTVGQTLELGAAAPPVPPVPPTNWKFNARIWGEATGFIGLFMVPLALVLGGAFGRRNVLWANQVARSARLRVLWHNSLSWWLLAISVIHMLLFLYEEVYAWSVGFIWGGIGTLALVGLGLTGAYQRRLARSMGYANWRLLHIAMAVTFVVAVLAHVLIDGAHFDVFRVWLGFEEPAAAA